MAASAETSFPFDDVAQWVSLTLHRPHHGNRSPVLWHRRNGNHFPMLSVDMILEFLTHGLYKFSAVILS